MATFAALFFILDELCDEELESQILNECSDDEAPLLLLLQSRHHTGQVRMTAYFEEIVPRYSPSDFRSHFRMSRGSVSFLEGLLAVFPELPQMQSHGGRAPVDLRKQILITLWILGNPECLRGCVQNEDRRPKTQKRRPPLFNS